MKEKKEKNPICEKCFEETYEVFKGKLFRCKNCFIDVKHASTKQHNANKKTQNAETPTDIDKYAF